MSRAACAMERLVEARRDGRLDTRDAASVGRHLAGCATCAALARDLERLGELARRPAPVPAPTELARRRGRLRLMQAAASAPERRWTGRWIIAAGAIAAAGAMILVGLTMGQEARPVARLDPVLVAPTIAIERTETTVVGAEGARFQRSANGSVEVVNLETGTIRLSVRPLRVEERFLVRTLDAEVEVRGTVFEVEADAGRIQRVSVVEGKVDVVHGGRRTLVEAGSTWRAPVVPASEAALADVRPSNAGRPAAHSSAVRSSNGHEAPAEIGRVLIEGVGLMERGDNEGAAAALISFAEASPEDPRAEDAAFLAILALQRAGRHAEAVEAARRFIARYPEGFRRHEAEAIAQGN